MMEAISALAVVACGYTSVACVCRMRHPSKDIKTLWKLLHVAVFTLSLLILEAALRMAATDLELATAFLLAVYMVITQKTWAEGVPNIARNVPIK